MQFLFEDEQGHIADEHGVEPIFFFFFFGKYSSTGQLIIHLRAAQWWAERYYKDPQGIFEKKKELGCHHILGKKHKQFLLKCIDENLFADLTEIVEHLL